MKIRTGIDIMCTERIDILILIEKNGSRFIRRRFNNEKTAYCRCKAKPHPHYAARLAAKEAAGKVLGISLKERSCWRDSSIAVTESGAPLIAEWISEAET
jgi:holo-[acyl-carrier protein] synthase